MTTGSTPRPPGVDTTPALRSAVRSASAGLVVLTVLSAVVGLLVSGSEGLWGALLGAAIGGGFVLVTAVSVLATNTSEMTTMAAVVLGAWLVKMVLLGVGMFFLVRADFFDPVVLFAVVAISAVGLLGLETRAVLAARVPYVSPETTARP